MRKVCFYSFQLLLLAAACPAATVVVAGGTAPASVQTNSVFASVDFEDGFFASTSETDSQLALSPFPADWQNVREGTLLCEMAVVSGASNTVTVLFGDCADPALSVTFADGWRLVAPGTFPAEMPLADGAIRTNRLALALRTLDAQGNVHVGATDGAGTARETRFKWPSAAYLPENWPSATVWLAGAEAKLLSLRLKYRPDPSLLIMR